MACYKAIEEAVKNGRPIPDDAIDLPTHYDDKAKSCSLNGISCETLINADYEHCDYEHCLGRINYLQKYISSLEQRVELLNAQIALLEAKGLMRKH